MPVATENVFVARCRCGEVELAAEGPVITHLACYCDDCQRAADLIDALPGGQSGRRPDGGTANVLFRKDRVRVLRGEDRLDRLRARPESWTDRVFASCCATAVMQIHHNWWPHRGIKAHLFGGDAPPLEMRIFTKYARDPSALPTDVPAYRTYPPSFAARLVGNAIAVSMRRAFG